MEAPESIYKLRFCAAIRSLCDGLRAKGRHVIVAGDYNIAHTAIDLARPDQNVGNPGYLPEERAWMDTFLAAGYIDTFRHLCPEPGHYSWWTYRVPQGESEQCGMASGLPLHGSGALARLGSGRYPVRRDRLGSLPRFRSSSIFEGFWLPAPAHISGIRRKPMRIRYNAPVTLTFTFISAIVLILSITIMPSLTAQWFSTPAPFRTNVFADYIKLFTYIFGHASVQHYMGNFTMILLLGPILELAYGSGFVLLSIVITAATTGLLNVLIFPNTVLLGASGIVFMMIILSSITNYNKGEIPLTFILVMIVYLGGQVWDALAKQDNISQFAHIAGGLVGSFMGFFRSRSKA